jgi:hypothetical protein
MSKHNRTITKIVHEFRKDLAEHRSTFFLIYTDLKADGHSIAVKVTSNSTQDGASQILGSMMEPTEAAVALLASALPRGFLPSKKRREQQARKLLDKLRKMFVLSTLDPKQLEEPEDDRPKLVS